MNIVLLGLECVMWDLQEKRDCIDHKVINHFKIIMLKRGEITREVYYRKIKVGIGKG